MESQIEGMTKALDSWMMKYAEKEIGHRITDVKRIAYQSVSATQDPQDTVWKVEVKGYVVHGPVFTGTFSFKLDPDDQEWMIKNESIYKVKDAA